MCVCTYVFRTENAQNALDSHSTYTRFFVIYCGLLWAASGFWVNFVHFYTHRYTHNTLYFIIIIAHFCTHTHTHTCRNLRVCDVDDKVREKCAQNINPLSEFVYIYIHMFTVNL